MKKCYKAPEIVVVDLDLVGVICGSEKNDMGETTDPIGDGGDGTSDAASYRSSLWN